jgi:hypothetical protein
MTTSLSSVADLRAVGAPQGRRELRRVIGDGKSFASFGEIAQGRLSGGEDFSELRLPAGSSSVRFLFCPEVIGSICYLAHHEELIGTLRGGVYSEMTGNDNSLLFQRTRQDTHRLDGVTRYVLGKRGKKFREAGFNELVGNDEKVINGPGSTCRVSRSAGGRTPSTTPATTTSRSLARIGWRMRPP